MTIQNPPGQIIEIEAQKAASNNGFRLEHGIEAGWLHYGSTTAEVKIWLAASSSQGPWFLSLSHDGVSQELKAKISLELTGPGKATFIFDNLSELYAALGAAYRLSVSLPDVPFRNFQKETVALPKSTEAERLVVQRVGQNIFRAALFEYWNGKCPLTGISEPELLRASHIIPWAECETDAQRLDVHNGLLLSALWDAAFDKGLISFSEDGVVLVSDKLTSEAYNNLRINKINRLVGLTNMHHVNLAAHRERYGF